MKLLMTLLVRNEAEMVEANLDYHLAQGVDHVIVIDHDSTDGTGEILARYEQKGVATVIHEPGDEHHQSRRVTHMAQLALTQHQADWVFHNDADEFWWPLSGSLRDVFAAIPAEYGQIEVTRYNFLPRPDGAGPFYSRLVYRERESLNPSGRPLEPKVAHRPHPDVTVAPGNHWIYGAALRPVPLGDLLQIFHYPMRSYEQFERKVVQIGVGYEKLEFRSPEVGRDQLKLLEVQRENKLRGYYDGLLLDEAALDEGLASQRVVIDRRLETFMRSRTDLVSSRERPDTRATRTIVASALRALLNVEVTQETLKRTEAELELARATVLRQEQDLAFARTFLGTVASLGRHAGADRLIARTPRIRRLWDTAKQALADRRLPRSALRPRGHS